MSLQGLEGIPPHMYFNIYQNYTNKNVHKYDHNFLLPLFKAHTIIMITTVII